MASKPSKKSSGGSPRNYSEVYKSSATAGASAVQQSAPASAGLSSTVKSTTVKSIAAKGAPTLSGASTVDWWAEYGYVLNDLKYLGLVTLSLLVAIIVIGLFL